MEQDRYDRTYWTIDVRVDQLASGRAELTIGPRDPTSPISAERMGLARSTVAQLAVNGPPPHALAAGRVGRLLRRLAAEQARAVTSSFGYGLGGPRIAVDIRHDDLVPLRWEVALERAVDGPATRRLSRLGCPVRVVRVVPTPPRVADRAQSLPLRFLQLGRRRSRDDLTTVIGSHRWVGVAGVFDSTASGQLDEWRRASGWPDADVLYIPDSLPAAGVLSTAPNAPPLTLGWLSRQTALLQTRLVIIDCETEDDARRAQSLALSLAARGGPAAIVLPAGLDRRTASRLVEQLCLGLLHNEQLDVLVVNQRWLIDDPIIVVGGVGREDLLRLTNIIDDLAAIGGLAWAQPTMMTLGVGMRRQALLTVAPAWQATADWWSAPRQLGYQAIQTSPLRPPPSMGEINLNIDSQIVQARPDWRFEFSEMEGAVPAARAIEHVRGMFGIDAVVIPSPRLTAVSLEPKYVNPLLAAATDEGGARPVPRDGSALEVGQRYFLHLGVGPQSENARAFGLTPLQELDLTDLAGTWVEIGITGLDFEVEGPPTRELHVPYGNIDSDSVAFAVRPMRAGTSQLRYSIYINQNLVRSYILAARTRHGQEPPGSARDLAAALGAPKRALGRAGWVVRLEYSTTSSFASDRPPRVLSIISNHDDDHTSTITVKGVDTFGVKTSKDLSGLTEAIRAALDEISKPRRHDIKDDRLWPYGFEADNRGTDPQLEEHLCRLADLGWELYSKTIEDNAGVSKALEADGGVIHVAALLRDEVMPWAAMYGRKYDKRQFEDEAGNPVEHRACLAALPPPDGALRPMSCGEHPDCLLNEARVAGAPNVAPTTVACPRHFWGFRHIIELPPQTTHPSGPRADDDSAPELPADVDNRRPARVVVGAHGGLSQQDKHLRSIGGDGGASFKLDGPYYGRQKLISALIKPDPDIVYFYCHAEGSNGGRRNPALLLRTVEDGADQVVESQDLDDDERWTHRPLVFVNACRTGGFRPDAISPFVDTLITKRGGGALIATEIDVFEQLASKVAEWLFADVSSKKEVGPTLLRIRRRLLARRNVLGLAYALYGASELHFEQ